MTDDAAGKDWVQNKRMIFWGWPAVGLVVSGFWNIEAWAWPPLLAWMGVACLMNARRCGRRHCYYTGPFFSGLAVVSLVYGLGLSGFTATDQGWHWIGGVLIGGWLVLHYGVEAVWGKYRHSS